MKSRGLLLFLLFNYYHNYVECCNRKPQGAINDQAAVDENFQITIGGNPSRYIPGQKYNITLSCPKNFQFLAFTIVAETEPNAPPGDDMTGHFEIIDAADTQFRTQCENMLENANMKEKIRVDVHWIAPTNPNSTCIYIKAAVLPNRNVWFADGNFLAKVICPEEIDEKNNPTRLINPCCACDEAKYELILERHWTRNTHPKNFPEENLRTRFSEIIGASHSFYYRFWDYNTIASPGLKELAEQGATKTLEDEIKAQIDSGDIRTIIKAPGIPFRQNVAGTTLATVRVDPKRHIISLVTKIIPSPDWVLGVAALELCLSNCTWIESKILNLFPWDAGTDSGASYESHDEEQKPADVVRRITSTFPSDDRSPFYEKGVAPMKPMATLYIKRKKLYDRACDQEDNTAPECSMHPWVDWTDCSTKCGPGIQYSERAYKDPILAARYNCENVLRQNRGCTGEQCGLREMGNEPEMAECALTQWTEWSPCSSSCGRGVMRQTRNYINSYAREKCQAGNLVTLEHTRECFGNECGGTITGNNGDYNPYYKEPGLMRNNNNNNNYDQKTYSTSRQDDSRIEQGGHWLSNNGQSTYDNTENNNYDFNNMRGEDQGYINNNNNNGQESIFGAYNEENNNNNNNNEDMDNNHLWNSNSLRKPFYKQQTSDWNGQDQRGQQGFPSSSDYYPSQQDRSRFNNNNNFNDNEGIREVFNKFGRGGLVAKGIEADQFTVVQDYCFEMPVVNIAFCEKKQISNFWFYDSRYGECSLFTTDNCNVNKNQFRSLETCESTCLTPILNRERLEREQQENDDSNNLFNSFGRPESQVRPSSGYERQGPQKQQQQFQSNNAIDTPTIGDIEPPTVRSNRPNNRRLSNDQHMNRNQWNNQYRSKQMQRGRQYDPGYDGRNPTERNQFNGNSGSYWRN